MVEPARATLEQPPKQTPKSYGDWMIVQRWKRRDSLKSKISADRVGSQKNQEKIWEKTKGSVKFSNSQSVASGRERVSTQTGSHICILQCHEVGEKTQPLNMGLAKAVGSESNGAGLAKTTPMVAAGKWDHMLDMGRAQSTIGVNSLLGVQAAQEVDAILLHLFLFLRLETLCTLGPGGYMWNIKGTYIMPIICILIRLPLVVEGTLVLTLGWGRVQYARVWWTTMEPVSHCVIRIFILRQKTGGVLS